jgi:hypothetical protein
MKTKRAEVPAENPKSKIQNPNKLQIPTSKGVASGSETRRGDFGLLFGVWCLELGAYLGFGI